MATAAEYPKKTNTEMSEITLFVHKCSGYYPVQQLQPDYFILLEKPLTKFSTLRKSKDQKMMWMFVSLAADLPA